MLCAWLEEHAISSDVRMKISEAISKPTVPMVSINEKMKHCILSKGWDEVIGKYSFADFLHPIPFTTLWHAVPDNLVIVINISEVQSKAIIPFPNSHLPVLICLPDPSPQNLTGYFTQLLVMWAWDVMDCFKLNYGVLWDFCEVVVLPVKDHLLKLKVVERMGIWWCATLKLCGLPLHTVGPYSHKQKNFPDISGWLEL